MQTPEPDKSIEETPDFDALDYPKEQDDTQEDSPSVEEPTVEVSPPSDDDEEEIEVEVKVIEPEVGEGSTQDQQVMASLIQEVGTYTGRASEPTSQYMQVGALIDMWADVIEGYGDKAEEFIRHFENYFKTRDIKLMKRSVENLQSTGLVSAPYRKMIFYRRYPVTMTVYIATQGKDLYVSWRAFAQAKLAIWKLGILGGVSALVGLLVINLLSGFSRAVVDLQVFMVGGVPSYPLPNVGAGIFWGGLFFVLVGGWICLQGYQKLDGDFLGYFREPIYELTADDVASASAAVHKSIIHSADKLGIDTTKLEEREPFYKTRKKRRF